MEKRIFNVAMFALVSLSMAACGGEGGKASKDGDIVGTWKPVKATFNGEELPFFAAESECGTTTMEVTADNKMIYKGFDTVTTDEGVECNERTQEATYSVEGTKITLNAGANTVTGDLKLTDKTLTIEFKSDMNGDGKEDVRVESYERIK